VGIAWETVEEAAQILMQHRVLGDRCGELLELTGGG